jgi:hypothetical protein
MHPARLTATSRTPRQRNRRALVHSRSERSESDLLPADVRRFPCRLRACCSTTCRRRWSLQVTTGQIWVFVPYAGPQFSWEATSVVSNRGNASSRLRRRFWFRTRRFSLQANWAPVQSQTIGWFGPFDSNCTAGARAISYARCCLPGCRWYRTRSNRFLRQTDVGGPDDQ